MKMMSSTVILQRIHHHPAFWALTALVQPLFLFADDPVPNGFFTDVRLVAGPPEPGNDESQP